MLVRERKKVQKMPRSQRVNLALFALFGLCLHGAILPEGIEFHTRKAVTPIRPEPAAVWQEYGLQEAERAEYEGEKSRFAASAWRLTDATSALAALQLLRGTRPAGATLLQRGNYILQFEGFSPAEETINQLILHVPRFDNSSLPALTGFIPSAQRHGNSERYILGPASLQAFAPAVSPSLAAFQYATEGQLARYKDKDGDVTLVVFSYPNPQIAKERLAAFREQTPFVVTRSGPLVAAILQAATPDAGQRILAQVRWEANVTLTDQMPETKGDNLGVLFLNVVKFTGLLILFALVAGGLFAGFRRLMRKFSGEKPGDDAAVIALHIDETPSK